MRHSSNTIPLSQEFAVEDEVTEGYEPNQNHDPHQNYYSSNHYNTTPHTRPKNYTHSEGPSSGSSANESKGKSKLEVSLTKLVRLVANVTESYTSAIFVADTKNKVLHSLAHHSLSRDYIEGVQIAYGRGLVGWTAENKVRITVCPFEHDASTLLYYPSDQGLKSFIAVPILTSEKEVIGVIACDSKKSYAFAKITEKILTECAAQAELLIQLHQANESLSSKRTSPKTENELDTFIEKLRTVSSENDLLERVCTLPQSILTRDALIALVTSNEGYGDATFYSHTPDARVEHHLMDLVCKNKKIISTEKSVHVLPSDDIRARSFLSVPFHVFNKEAGALNILSAAFAPFSTTDVQTLERLAKVIGRELERFRSKAIAHSRQVGPSLLPWRHFALKSNKLIAQSPGEHALLRVQLENLLDIESTLGVDVCSEVHEQLVRFVQQLAPNPMLASSPYGTSIFVFGPVPFVENVRNRLTNIIGRIHSVNGVSFSGKLDSKASELLSSCLSVAFLQTTKKVGSIEEMLSSLTKKEETSKSFFSTLLSGKNDQAKITPIKEEMIDTEVSRSMEVSRSSENYSQNTSAMQSSVMEAEEVYEEEQTIISLTTEVIEAIEETVEEEYHTTQYESEELDSEDNYYTIEQANYTRTSSKGPSNLGSQSQDLALKKENKSIEEFILGESVSNFRSKKNARFW